MLRLLTKVAILIMKLLSRSVYCFKFSCSHLTRDFFKKLSDGFNGADLRNVVTEAGMFAIRDDREYVNQEDLTKAARKVGEAKKHESEFLPGVSIALTDPEVLHSENGVLDITFSSHIHTCSIIFLQMFSLFFF